MTLQTDIETAVANITAARDVIVADKTTLHGIVHGPSSGTGSTVTTDAGSVKSLARVVAEAEATTGGRVITPQQYGALGDDATDDTAAFQLWLDALKNGTAIGLVPPGTYRVQANSLNYTLSANGAGPKIIGCGLNKSIIKAIGSGAGPILTIAGASNVFVDCCEIDGLDFSDIAPASTRHAISLKSVRHSIFRSIRGNSLGAQVFNIPLATDTGLNTGNPDTFNVAFNTFESIVGESCGLIKNDNGVGFTNNDMQRVVSASATHNVFYGLGSMNRYRGGSISACETWVIDSPTTGPGTRSREVFEDFEIDGCHSIARAQKIDDFVMRRCRIIHRWQSGSSTYWPRNMVEISDGSVTMKRAVIQLQHIFGTGGVKGDLGSLGVDLKSNANLVDVDLDIAIRDDAAFGFTFSEFIAGLATSTSTPIAIRMRYEGVVVLEKNMRYKSHATKASGAALPTSGWGTATAKVAFGSEVYDSFGIYDHTTGDVTLPISGRWRFRAKVSAASVTNGKRVRLGLIRDRAGVLDYVAGDWFWQAAATAQPLTCEIDIEVVLNAADVVYVIAETDNGATNTYGAYSQAGSNFFIAEYVGNK